MHCHSGDLRLLDSRMFLFAAAFLGILGQTEADASVHFDLPHVYAEIEQKLDKSVENLFLSQNESNEIVRRQAQREAVISIVECFFSEVLVNDRPGAQALAGRLLTSLESRGGALPPEVWDDFMREINTQSAQAVAKRGNSTYKEVAVVWFAPWAAIQTFRIGIYFLAKISWIGRIISRKSSEPGKQTASSGCRRTLRRLALSPTHLLIPTVISTTAYFGAIEPHRKWDGSIDTIKTRLSPLIEKKQQQSKHP